jgi:hypothetical protein
MDSQNQMLWIIIIILALLLLGEIFWNFVSRFTIL